MSAAWIRTRHVIAAIILLDRSIALDSEKALNNALIKVVHPQYVLQTQDRFLPQGMGGYWLLATVFGPGRWLCYLPHRLHNLRLPPVFSASTPPASRM
jgi:hypothetical protein